ncbi:MAG: DUF2764 family protein [Kiritimatiellia bacterium]
MNPYFLIASLPLLHLGQRPPISLPAFLQTAGEHLPPGNMAVLRDLLEADGRHSPDPFAREWFDRETELRNLSVRIRARHRGISPDGFLRPQKGNRVYLQTAVADAFQAPNPLDREKALDQIRWRMLDELAGLNPFGLETIYSYVLKLRLAWRWASFDPEKGAALLETAAAGAAERQKAEL